MSTEDKKEYPIGGYAPGNYYCRCITCNEQFFGDKRAHQCEPCAIKDKEWLESLTPEQQQAHLEENAAIYRQFIEDNKTQHP